MRDVELEGSAPFITVRINRPQALNALNAEVLSGLREAVHAARDPAVRAMIVTATGEKAFSAGADLRELDQLGPEQAHELLSKGQAVFRELERAAVPVIAAVNGIALGGGFELVLACTFPVLSTAASFGLPESGLGLIPGYGGTQRLPRRIGSPSAAYLMLTGARLDADRAYQLGLSPLPPVPPAQLTDVASQLAERVAAQGPRAVRSILRAMDAGRDAALDTGLALETTLAAIAVSGAESTEGIAAFRERRPADFHDNADAR